MLAIAAGGIATIADLLVLAEARDALRHTA